jgi:hypothetical protein
MHGWMHMELNMVFSVVALQPVERQRSQAPQIQTSGTSRLRLGLFDLAGSFSAGQGRGAPS